MKIKLLVKEVTTKTLVSGDKSARIILETVDPEDIRHLGELSEMRLVDVDINPESE